VSADEVVDRVAAVCYRITAASPEFLLVRSTDGEGWTFPKGKVELRESLPDAAMREALEEAGVTGTMVLQLSDYHYPHPPTRSVLVRPYLLKVLRTVPPVEVFRTPAWVEPSEAVVRLGIGREDWVQAEATGVIEEALEHIQPSSTDLIP
jgi:8-oxo-dGTP pyrophosphatase MutT (NUDIX family)